MGSGGAHPGILHHYVRIPVAHNKHQSIHRSLTPVSPPYLLRTPTQPLQSSRPEYPHLRRRPQRWPAHRSLHPPSRKNTTIHLVSSRNPHFIVLYGLRLQQSRARCRGDRAMRLVFPQSASRREGSCDGSLHWLAGRDALSYLPWGATKDRWRDHAKRG